jgi:NAD-dependent deacetylase
LNRSKRVTALTGAGISAESGVPTFRGPEGLWKEYRPEDLATPFAFQEDPKLVWEWYDWRRGLISKCEPNAAHKVLVEMERAFDDFLLITQNVDGLHQLAGSKHMVTIHGNIFTVRCTKCGVEFVDRRAPLPELPPTCQCGGLLRPAVVWFHESLRPDDLMRATEAASRCEVMFVIGTSGIVYPAAGLPHQAKSNGAIILEFNLAPSSISEIADASFFGKAGETLPRFWNEVTRQRTR